MRLAAIAATGAAVPRFGDAPPYQAAAKSLAESGRYPDRTDPHYFRAPGYSFFLAVVTLGHPERVLAAKVANAVAGALAALVLAAISARLFRDRAAAAATAVAASLDPSLVLVSIDLQSEALFVLLVACSGFLLLASVDRPSSNLGVAAGAFLGLAALTRPSALAIVPLLAAPLADRRHPVRARAHLAASALLGFVLTVAPWTVRNAVRFGEFIPISDVGGFNFYLGNSPQMLRFFDARTREEYNAWSDETDRLIGARMDALRAAGITSPGAVNRTLVRETIGSCLADPGGWALLLAKKTWDWLRPYPNPLFWPRAVVIGIGLLYGALYLLAARGLAIAPRRGVTLFSLGVLAASMAAHVLTVVSWRYRVPYWDPILLLYAAPAAIGLVRGRAHA